MVEVASIPTVYAGIQFRSRLEARWAAFFDAMGWRWSYEPIDRDGWIPDFNATINGIARLVEVKPAPSIEALEDYAVNGRQLSEAPDGTLVLGAHPIEAAIGVTMHVSRSLGRRALEADRMLLRAIEEAHSAREAARKKTPSIERMAKGCGLTVHREVACAPLEVDPVALSTAWPIACNATQYKGVAAVRSKRPDPEDPNNRVLSGEEAAEQAAKIISMLRRRA